MKPSYLLGNENGSMVLVVLTLLAIIVIAAVLVMKFILGASTPSPTPPPAVVRIKIPPMPNAEPKKADSLQPPLEVEGNAETVSDQSHIDSTPAEPNVEAPAVLSSPADASSATETGSAQASVTEGTNLEPQSENAGVPTANALPLIKEKTEVAPEQEVCADSGEPVKTEMIRAMGDAPPDASAESAVDFVGTAVTAVAAAEGPKEPAGQDIPEPTVAATPTENEALFTVQVGAFHTKAYAEAKLEELKRLGYPAYIFEVTNKKQQPLYLVCFGRFRTLAEAGDTMAAFKVSEKMPAVVTRPKSW